MRGWDLTRKEPASGRGKVTEVVRGTPSAPRRGREGGGICPGRESVAVRSAMTRGGSPAEHRSFWRSVYEENPYDALPWFDTEPSPPVARAVAEKFLVPRTAVLDVGCGAGSNVLFLARHGFESHGIDLSPGAVRAAQERARAEGLTIDVRVGDALDLDFPGARFDGLIDNGCFHTLPVARRKDYAHEVARVLRPGAAFVLSWVAREHGGPHGPPHRPSLEEVSRTFEERFLFLRTEFHPPNDRHSLPLYDAWLSLRRAPRPPAR